jgi:pimeloyl-ACP methyl ester carboxylesterase
MIRLRFPTLIITAVDQNVPLEMARTVVKQISNASNYDMKNCSHWPQLEDAETYNERSL